MPQETVKFTISQDGTVTEEVIGFTDGECINITKDIEEKLGNVTYTETKPEYYLAQPIENFWKNTTDVTLQHDQDQD